MKKTKKIVSILLIIAILAVIFATVVNAGNPVDAMKDFNSQNGNNILNKMGSKIFGVLQLIGSIVAFVMLAVIAIKYIKASAEEKADVKKTLVGYVIGVIILLCCITFLQIAKSFGDEISKLGVINQKDKVMQITNLGCKTS